MNSEAHRNNDSSDSLQPGLSISHYIIVEKIGEGGMGEVYLAEDTRLRRQVALKILPAKFAADEEFKKRFVREAHTAAAVSHPNIVTIHDVEIFRGRPYIVMEYLSGQTLKGLLRKRELSPEEIVEIALQIAAGMERAHDAGIVHRDLKSDNIVLTDDRRIKILDFGLARTEQDENLTQTGTALGTVAYMSPEQAQGRTVDQRSDLFSFGVVLYEMATRRLPFTGQNMAAAIHSIINSDPESIPPEKLGGARGLSAVVTRLLAKEADDRYDSAADVIVDLKRVGRGLEPTLPQTGKRGVRFIAAGAVLVLLIAATVKWVIYPIVADSKKDTEGPLMLAVLPFQNTGGADQDYFASGITDEITTQMTKLRGVRVVSRTSSAQYQGSSKSYRQIADELGVNYLLEGSVQWDNADSARRVRINTSLTDVKDGTSLWAESYHRVIDDIFAVQSDIARNVMAALNVALVESEEQLLDRKPTSNLEAYNLYLQGLTYFNNGDWNLAQNMFSDAVALDTGFAEAWAALSRTESLVYWWYIDRSEQRLLDARAAAEKALSLDSSLAEAYLAMGRYYYRGYLDYDHALEWYNRALALQPGNSDLLFAIGSTKRRQGEWQEAVRFYQEAITLDPRSRTKLTNLARTYFLTRDNTRAMETVDRLLALAPDYAYAYELKARILAFGLDSTEQAKRVVNDGLRLVDHDELIDVRVTLCLAADEADSAFDLLWGARHDNYFLQDSAYFYLQMGEICRSLGQDSRSRAVYDSALAILSVEIKSAPDEPQYHSMLGVAFAGAGDSARAVKQGERAVDLGPVSADAVTGAMWRHNLAIIYTMVGDYESAATELRFLLTSPSDVTKPYLSNYPAFQPMRKRDDFQTLLEL